MDIFVKRVMPTYRNSTSAAVAVMYRGNQGTPAKVSFRPDRLGLDYAGGYRVTDVFTGENLGSVTADQTVTYKVNPNGVRLVRFDVKPSKIPEEYHEKKNATGPAFSVENMGRTGWYGDEL